MVGMSKAKAEPKSLPKRFYRHADVAPTADGFLITLDGKKIKTPARHDLRVSTLSLAQAIVAEWQAQHTVIDPDQMPLTRLAHIAIDRVAQDRAQLLIDIGRYAETDLLCYRAPVAPQVSMIDSESSILRLRQEAAFDPILSWVAQHYAAPFYVTDGLLPVAQPESSLAAIAAVYAATTNAQLAALAMMVPLLGSALLTLAVWQGQCSVDAAVHMAQLDESVQAEKWGVDPEVQAALAKKAEDIRACAFFLTCN